MIKLAVLVVVVLALGGWAYIRLAPSDPARWHEDPRLVARPATPNFHLIRMVGGDAMPRVYPMSSGELASALHDIAIADGAVLIAGRVADLHMTYLTRSPTVGFPDYTSVRVEPAGAGAMVTAFARARFGRSDMGANRARLERWLDALGTAAE